MVALSFSPLYSPAVHLLKPPINPTNSLLKPFSLRSKIPSSKRKVESVVCRSELSHDAPFAAAIGACILSSLVLPNDVASKDEASDSALDSTDTRFTVMGIISFIPYFNWMSWVFAWLDTGKRRYGLYAIAYLAPYLRSNLSLSPEDSWLPFTSIILGIIHVQLETSIRNGDIQDFQVFSNAARFLTSMTRKKDENLRSHQQQSGQGREEHKNLPSTEEQSRNEIQWKGVPRHPSEHAEHPNGGWEDDDDDDDNDNSGNGQ